MPEIKNVNTTSLQLGVGRGDLDNNWIVENLTNAFGVWTNKMTEMWSLLTKSLQTFKGGTIWQTSHIFSSIKKLRC